MNRPTLYIFSGLPAVGKSTLAQLLAKHLSILYVRIDTVEQGLRDLCDLDVEGEGYQLSYRIIQD
ncbi:ATP-binding protein, partial [Alkalimonas collagenimarina]|nr:ATP-binding protein [Alkalimonas collagenimarina]